MMEKLKALVQQHRARTKPATADSIEKLQQALQLELAPDYAAYLSSFGVIVHGTTETYGLGVPDDYFLNVGASYADLSRDPAYPRHAVPLLDVGDGRYYLYDNGTREILLWATPNGGIVKVLDEGLETFLIRQLFGDAAT